MKTAGSNVTFDKRPNLINSNTMEQEQIDDVREQLEGRTIESVEYTDDFYEPFTLTLDDGTLVYSSGTGTQGQTDE